MTAPILIVGAGLSGLSAAWHCQQLGLDYRLIESRERLGGRALTHRSSLGAFDLGPSWVWQGQPFVARLLEHFSIPSFEQYCDGALLHQTPDGQIHRNDHLKPMQGALRIQGGVGSLVEAMAGDLDRDRVQLGASITGVQTGGSGLRVSLNSQAGEELIDVHSLALAIPPRLLSTIKFQPEISLSLQTYTESTPTWMAAQAKFFAIYRKPFWREHGLSGDAFCSSGVLGEIHDASDPQLASKSHQSGGGFYALFGFVRWDAQEREAKGVQSLRERAVEQLVELFGPDAASPLDTLLQDWSTEPLTAAISDRQMLGQHPHYRPAPSAGEHWQQSLHLISAETSATSGGLIEGAIERGAQFASACAQRV